MPDVPQDQPTSPSSFRCDDPDCFDDDDGSCFACGGSGVLDDWCECQYVEDVCCCLNPVPQTCDVCGGAG